MVQRDYILRLIEQFVAMVARIVGLSREGNVEAARRELEEAYVALGVPRSMVANLDSASIKLLVGEEKARALAVLFSAEAELARAEGREKEAAAWRARAAGLGL